MLSEIMKEKNITSRQLAEKTGIPKRTIDGYRRMKSEPSLSNGLKIAEVLGVDPRELISSDGK